MPISLSDLEQIDVFEAYARFRAGLDVDTDSTWTEWICKNTFINGEPFGFRGYEHLIQPVNDNHPRQAIAKPAQVGASEVWARKMFAILHRYSTVPYYYDDNGVETCVWGINSIYSFPDTDNLRRFAKDRLVTDIINNSPVLAKAKKASESEAIDQLGVYNSFCYLTGRRTDSGNQSIPAEVVFIDEYDRPLNIDRQELNRRMAALAARTQNARIFGNQYSKGLQIGYGTPTYPDETGVLIDGLIHLSDQMTWMVKCTHCGKYQEVLYPDSIAHFYERGEKPGKKDPYWQCLKCKKPLDFTVIGRWTQEKPNLFENAEWVPKYPERTADGGGIRGYTLPFATLRNTAKRILAARDGDYKHSTQDFYNYALGKAYRDNSIGVSDEDFVRNVTGEAAWGFYDPEYPHIMSGDQGCYIVIARLKKDSQTDLNPKGIWQVVYAEQMPDAEAFSKVERDGDNKEAVYKGKISRLIELWKPTVALFDRLPNVASAEAEQKLNKEVMWLNDSKGNTPERMRFQKDEWGDYIHHVLENKHECIDFYFDELRGKRWEFAAGGSDVFAKMVAHNKNVKKIVDGTSYRYISFGEDHFCQAMKLLSEAAEIHCMLRPKITRAGIIILTGYKEGRD